MKAFIGLLAIVSSVSAGVLAGVDLFRGYYTGGAQQEFSPSIHNGVPLQTLLPPLPPSQPSENKLYQSPSSVAPIIRLLQGPLSSPAKSLNIVNSHPQQLRAPQTALKTLKLIRTAAPPQEAIKSIQLIRQIPEIQGLPVAQEELLPGLQGVQILQDPTGNSMQLFEAGYAPEPKSLQILQADMPQRMMKAVQLLQPGPVEELKTMQFHQQGAPKITAKALQMLQPSSNPGVEIQAIRILKQTLSPDISHVELVRHGETILGDENSFQILN